MKRNPFYKSSTLLVSALFLTFAFTSCKKQTTEITQSPEEIATAKAGSKPGTYPAVALRMTVDDAPGNRITSDVSSDYVNGLQNMKVEFDMYGNFMFNSKASNKPNVPMIRWLNYSLNDPTSTSYPVRSNDKGSSITTGATFTSPAFTPLQNLDIGITQCIGLSAGLFTLSGGVVNFHRNTSTEDTPTTPTAYVYVTRISETQWTVTPVPPLSGCSSISNVAALRVNGALDGYYNMPFSLTLTKL